MWNDTVANPDADSRAERESLSMRGDRITSADLAAVTTEPDHADTSPFRLKNRDSKMTVAYVGLWLFLFLYLFRPGDWYQPLQSIPIAKIAGIIPALAIIVAFLTGTFRLRQESKLLLLLFLDLCVCIPFSSWRTGSLELVLFEFSKVVLIVLVLMMVTNTFKRLRQLLVLQITAMLLLTVISLVLYTGEGRMWGKGYMFADPNDLALNLCIIIPLCSAFMMTTRSILKKLIWILAIGVASYAILATYSRGGFLATVAMGIAFIYQFGIKGRRYAVLPACALAALLMFAMVARTDYGTRLRTIFTPDDDPTNSAQSRRDLLELSLRATAAHPLLGVGPGNFALLGNWLQTHNTYTQLSSEAGLPALLLFLLLVRATFRNIKRVQSVVPIRSPEWAFAAALKCSFVGYLVGAFFLSTAYWFYPYLLMGYIAVLQTITTTAIEKAQTKAAESTKTTEAQIPDLNPVPWDSYGN